MASVDHARRVRCDADWFKRFPIARVSHDVSSAGHPVEGPLQNPADPELARSLSTYGQPSLIAAVHCGHPRRLNSGIDHLSK